jgi:hypothetical protein
MIYFIKDNQLKANLKKYNFQTADKEVFEQINQLQQKVVSDLLQQKKKQLQKQEKQQKGGRVAFPIDYFGGQTGNLTAETPAFTNISGNEVNLRQPMLLNDPTQALGTDKAMTSVQLGGAKQKYQLSQTAAQEAVKSLSKKEKFDLQDKQDFVRVTKQKFEKVIDDVLTKAQKQEKQHLSKQNLQQVLEQKKYKSFKA